MSLTKEKVELHRRLQEVGSVQNGVDEQIKQIDRQIKSELKKIKTSSLELIAKKLKELERKRTTSSMSLADEKNLLKQMDKLKLDRRLLEQVEEMKRQRSRLALERERISQSSVEIRLLMKDVDDRMQKNDLVERISKWKGGVTVTPNMLVKKLESIPKERIGQFVGKLGANLKKLEETHFVSLDVANDGIITISGFEEDVNAACASIADFRREVTENIPLTDSQARVLRSNKGTYLKNIESLLKVNLVLLGGNNNGNNNSSNGNANSNSGSEKQVLKVRGLPEHLARVKAALSELSATKEVVDVVPNGTFMKTLFAQSAQELHDLENAFNVTINVDRSEGTIDIAGSATQVKLASAKVKELARDTEEETLEIPLQDPELVSVVIGKKGETVKRLQQELEVYISVKKPGQEGSEGYDEPTIVLKGPVPKLAPAKAALLELFVQHEKENVTLQFPEEFHAAIYGQGGVIVKQIQDDTGANISIQRREARTDGIMNIFIRGNEEAVAKAAQELKKIVKSQTEIEVPIPDEARAAIIGTKGAAISNMQKESGASISIKDGLAVIRGSDEQVAAAKTQIEQAVEQYKRENQTIMILSSSVGNLIGKGGSTLKKIREESGANIDVPMEDQNEQQQGKADKYGTVIPACPVHIKGQPEQIEEAMKQIKALLGENVIDAGDEDKYREATVKVPSSESIRKLVGKSGETIQGIEQTFQVKVTVERSQDVVKIHGKAGKPLLDAISRVQDLLEQGVHLKENFKLGKKMSKKLATANNAANVLRRIQEETGTMITLQQKNEGSADDNGPYVVEIEGPAVGVRNTKEIFMEIERGIEREALKLPLAHLEMLNGEGKMNLERLETQCNVSVNFDMSRQIVRVIGKPKHLNGGKTELLRLIRFFFPDHVASISLPSAGLISQIIGKKGATIRKIQTENGVNVNIDRESNSVEIIGHDGENVTKAAQFVQDIVDTWNRENRAVPIPKEAISTLIGKKGATIQKIKEESGVENIDVDRDVGQMRLKGSPTAIEAATKIIKERVDQFERENAVLSIAQEEVPWVIGSKGATIKAIEQKHDVKVQIDKGSSLLRLQGSEDAIASAKDEIKEIIAKEHETREAKRVEELEKRKVAQEKRRQEIEEKRQREEAQRLEQEKRDQQEMEMQKRQEQDLAALQQENPFHYDSKQFSLFGPTLPSLDGMDHQQQHNGALFSSFGLATPIEMDHNLLRKAPPAPSSAQSTLNNSQTDSPARISGSEVMGMLLGSGDADQNSRPPPTPTVSAPPGFGSLLPQQQQPQQNVYSSFGVNDNGFGLGSSFQGSAQPSYGSVSSQFTLNNGANQQDQDDDYYQGEGGYSIRLS